MKPEDDSMDFLDDPRRGKPSASGMYRLCKCPGSWRLEQACPPSEESAEAAEGTLLHAHMEHGTLPEDAEQAELVSWCREKEAELVRSVFGKEPDAVDAAREERMWANEGAFSGQADVVYLAGEKALVIDYKFGRGEVEPAEANVQLGALAVLVWQRGGVSEVYASILQPRVSRKPELVRYGADELARTEVCLTYALAKAELDGACLCPGGLQCKYCRAMAVCPAQLELARQVTAADFLAVKGWEVWDAKQKRRAYDVAKLAEKWAASVQRKVEADLAAGVPVEGLELGAGRTSFTVRDAQGAFSLLSEGLGISGKDFAGCCKVGITELDKLVHARLKERGVCATVKESREWLRRELADVAECKTTKGSVKVVGGK